MSQRKVPAVFISYCHEDTKRNLVDFIYDALVSYKTPSIAVHYDKNVKYGEDFDDFMALLNSVDACVILLSPAYAKRVHDNTPCGVTSEFEQILTRYYEINRQSGPQHDRKGFKIFPVIVAGKREESTPDQIRSLHAADFAAAHILPGSTPRLAGLNEGVFRSYIKTVCEDIKGYAPLNSPEFHLDAERAQLQLFIDTKATSATPFEIPGFVEEIFVELNAFKNIAKQRSYFLIGRKGSGKSTIAGVLPAISQGKYNAIIAIQAEEINLKHAFYFLSEALRTDIKQIIQYDRFFNLVWHGIFRLCLIYQIEQLSNANKLAPDQEAEAKVLKSFIKDHRQDKDLENIASSLFIRSVSVASDFVEASIHRARKKSFSSDLELALNTNDYLTFLFGDDVHQALRSIVKKCRKKVLVTLDDFDTIFDTFRREANSTDRDAVVEFEQRWLSALFQLVVNLKKQKSAINDFYKTFDFCITIPKDRFRELATHERDGYRYNQNVNTLNWTGVQLAEMLRRRLERLTSVKTDSKAPEDQRLHAMLSKGLSGIPQKLVFSFNSETVEIDTFLYILRHTLWRPRGILHYITGIMAASEGRSGRGSAMSVTSLRGIISCLTSELIETEFIDEFESTISNLREILNKFTGSSQVLGQEEFQDKVKDLVIYESYYDHRKSELKDIIEVLYDIGFLGFRFDNDILSTSTLPKTSVSDFFAFNGGSAPFKLANHTEFKRMQFLVNPLFTEYLLLDHHNTEFVLNFNWDYIYDNHHLILGAGNSF